MRRIILKIFYILMISIFIIQTNISVATTKTELKDSKEDIEKQIDKAEEKLDEIKEEKSEALDQVETLIAEISEHESVIKDLDNEIKDLNSKIKEAEENINKAKKEYDEKHQLLDERLIAMYEEGNVSYLDIILSSKDVTEMISNYYMISELAECDTELLNQIEQRKKTIEDEKNKLETTKTEITNKKAEQQQKQKELNQAKSEKTKVVNQLTEDEKETQKEIEEFAAEKKAIQAELAEIARKEEEARKEAERKKQQQQNSSSSSSSSSSSYKPVVTAPSVSGYIFPVAGLSRGNIANKTYPSYAGHTGIDVNINVRGKNIVAVKSGTVVKSMAKTGSIKNYGTNGVYVGSYSSYGEYVVVNHHDGTMTLYAHMLAGTRRVKVGDKVSQGQVLGVVGNTGNVSPRPSESNPLAGTHLHFEVLVGGRPVNPMPYLP